MLRAVSYTCTGMFLKGNRIFDHKPDLPDVKTNGKNRLEGNPKSY